MLCRKWKNLALPWSQLESVRLRHLILQGTLGWVAMFCGPAIRATADDNRPLFVEVTELGENLYRLGVRVPPTIPSFNHPTLGLPDDVQELPPAIGRSNDRNAAGVQYRRYRSAKPLAGRRVEIRYPVSQGAIPTVARYVFSNGGSNTIVLGPGETTWKLPFAETKSRVARDYFSLGVYHIWEGIDHLLFVVCLIFIAGSFRRILTTITGFTVAHSITLALSALGIVKIPVPPIEAAIALSVVFLATEVCKNRRDSLTWRYPVAVSSIFGLLHGLGFAAVLNEIGLPKTELLTGLFFFNVGVEVGQVVFAIVVIAALAGLTKAFHRGQDEAKLDPRMQKMLGYGVGCVAAYWLVDRVAGFVS